MTKKIICILMSLTLALGLFAGCGIMSTTDEDLQEEEAEPLGRYVTTEIPLPIDVPQDVANRRTAFLRNAQGEFQFFYSTETKNKGPYRCATLQEDGSWTVEDAAAVNDALAQLPQLSVYKILYGNDGKLYTVLGDYYTAQPNVAVFLCEGEKAQQIELEGLESGTGMLNGAFVLSDGTVVLGRGDIQLYDMDSGKVAEEYKMHQPIRCMAQDDTFYYYAAKDEEERTLILTMKKLPDGEEVRLPSLKSEGSGEFPTPNLFAGPNGTLFYSRNRNLQYWTPGATLWEELISNQYDVFKYSDFNFLELYTEGDGFIAQTVYNNQTHIIRITFDPNAPLTEKELTVAGMTQESEQIQNAIAQFQKENPGVTIQYRQMVGENAYSSEDDAYKALNTEILAGKGPDVLLIDPGLLKNYISNGVLLPLEQQLENLKEEILPGVWQSSTEQNGSIYAMPVSFHAWTLLADKNTAGAFSSLHTLAAFAAAQETPLLPAEDWTQNQLFEMMMLLYSDEFYAANGSFDTARAETFLQDFKTIADQIGCTQWRAEAGGPTGQEWPGADFGGYQMAQGKALASLSRQQASYESFTIMLLRLYTAMSYNPNAILSIVKNAYEPTAFIGINVNSQEPELAARLLSEIVGYSGEANNEEGTSVSLKSLRQSIERIDEVCESLEEFDTFSEPVIPATDYILKKARGEEVAPIADTFYDVDRAAFIDQRTLEIQLPIVKAYLKGELTAKEAAEDMKEKQEIMQAER
ncbi:MAG: extracellular solute-binding protein [Oscillospiraceae bacterium]|nr:extracellular solute-binding protein [Oscillospiraceae bacterium]